MDLNLHKDAVTNFNEGGEMLFKELVIRPSSHYKEKSTFNPEIYVASEITEEKIIGDIRSSVLDKEGNEVGLAYLHKGTEIGLFEEGYVNLIKLAQKIHDVKALQSIVSVSFLKDNIFEWLKYRYLDNISIQMVDYIVDLCKKEVDDYEIWIPIPGISVQSEFKIGKIILKPISKDTIDRWFEKCDEKIKAELITRERKESQGFAAATIQLHAEPSRAKEVALSESEKAISLLRIFTPENFSPRSLSYCTLSGNRNLEKRKYLVVKNEQMMSFTDGFVDKNVYDLMPFSDEMFSMIWSMGLNILTDILCKEDRSEFQNQVLTSLLIYSRNSLEREVADKLIYILVSLESILLKDSNEPIMQNIGDRIAFLIGKPEKRMEIVQNVRDIYGLRSSFIHHGKDISLENLEAMKIFMQNSWEVNLFLIHHVYKFENKLELIKYIDKIKYGLK